MLYKPKLNITIIGFAIIALVFLGGWLAPHSILDDRDGLAWGNKASAAKWAIIQAQYFFDNPIQRFIITAYGVERMDNIPSVDYPKLPPEAGTNERLGILVKTYTLFGFPYKKVYITSTSERLIN